MQQNINLHGQPGVFMINLRHFNNLPHCSVTLICMARLRTNFGSMDGGSFQRWLMQPKLSQNLRTPCWAGGGENQCVNNIGSVTNIEVMDFYSSSFMTGHRIDHHFNLPVYIVCNFFFFEHLFNLYYTFNVKWIRAKIIR